MMSAVVVLTGCGETNQEDLQVWMQRERTLHMPTGQPIPAPADAQDQAQAYTHQQGVEPFSTQRLRLAVPADVLMPAKATLSPASLTRVRPSLEESPLEAIRLVGSLQRGGAALALLRCNGLIYSVRVGDRLGQDQGRVSDITLTQLLLRELVLDAAGHETERVVSLALVPEPS
jgi:type IV pilus assembly protein PilP